MGLKSLDSTLGTKPTTEAQLDFVAFNNGMVLQILRSGQIINGLCVFLWRLFLQLGLFSSVFSLGWDLLVVEPDYLPDAEVLCFQPCLYPMKYLHPRSMYTLPRGGVQRGGTPSAGSRESIPPTGGSGGKRAPSVGSGAASPDGGSGVKPPKQKLPYKSIL